MKQNISKIIIITGTLLIANNALADGNANRGQKIYAKSECLRCHQNNQLFTRSNRKVKTLAQLNAQVRRCDTQLNTHLFDDEIEDVVAYLNQAHYKFPPKNHKKIEEKKNTKEPAGD